MVPVAVVTALAVGAVGCGPNVDRGEAAEPIMATLVPSPSPSPGPPPPAEPVLGARAPTADDIGHGALLGPDDRGAVDEDGIRAFADAVFDWLDAHLTDLQAGGPGLLEAVAAPGLLEGDGAVLAAASTALAGPAQPVAAASYDLTAYHDHGPEFVTVVVRVTDPAGTDHAAMLVFVASPDGTPELVMIDGEAAA